ncbi:hypothetical protein [Actinocrispum wychmicini]|uniref:Uncharacterized protein n=1 Tax=Actinocrispum wychmicini TaxID=1213861 RepID=A0A4R2JCA3_9PSEU|nr:hypothetical protein [Actinocrispum wychmicini]TCO57181.1 hypothetical protein EV192_106658 [Actinocrispum wychmicini]
MAYESRAYDERHSDGSNTPVVVLVVKGTHDVSRLVHLFAGAPVTVEQLQVGKRLRKQVRMHSFGRAALRLLADHGGPDFTAQPAADEVDEDKVAYWGSWRRQDFISAGPDGNVDLSHAAGARRVDPVTARTLADQLHAAADYADRFATAAPPASQPPAKEGVGGGQAP